MTRGYSLEQDLRLLINNPKYSDLEILCEDEKKLHACRAILAARSESVGMEIVLEYTYTGSIKEESLTKDNIIEAFYAADYFQLPDLQNFIMKVFKNTLEKNPTENYSPELLSKFAGKMPLTEDNILLNLLVEAVANIPLNTIEFGRLSIAGLQFLLSCTYEKEMVFATPEYEVFRYSAILAAKHVSNDAYSTLMKQLPTIEQMQIDNSVQIKNKFITDHQNVAKELEPLIEFINFKRIKGQILADVIDPLEIIPSKVILNVYRDIARSNMPNLNDTRGIPKTLYVWDEKACGSNLIIEDNGKIVQAEEDCIDHQCVRGTIALENKGTFEWDIIIEKNCSWSWIRVCESKNFNYETFAGNQPTGRVLGSGGLCNSTSGFYYCLPFHEDGARITVHLDMNKRTCAFTVNGKKYREVSEWDNLPSKLYPVVSLNYPGRFRIQPHQKNV